MQPLVKREVNKCGVSQILCFLRVWGETCHDALFHQGLSVHGGHFYQGHPVPGS